VSADRDALAAVPGYRLRGWALVAGMMIAGCTASESDTPSSSQRRLEGSAVATDPRRCPGGGDGHLRIALGATLLRIPYTGVPLHRDLADGEGAPAIADPDVPEGCRERPAPAQRIHLQSLPESSLPHLGELTSVALTWLPEGRSRLQETHEALFDRLRTRGVCRDAPPDLLVCGSGAGPTLYRANSADTHWPRRHWIAVCGLGPSVLPDDCLVYAQILPQVALDYRFSLKQVEPARMARQHDDLRAAVASMVVRDGASARQP